MYVLGDVQKVEYRRFGRFKKKGLGPPPLLLSRLLGLVHRREHAGEGQAGLGAKQLPAQLASRDHRSPEAATAQRQKSDEGKGFTVLENAVGLADLHHIWRCHLVWGKEGRVIWRVQSSALTWHALTFKRNAG